MLSPVTRQIPILKKRKTDRACDACRRKKTRCDGPWSLNSTCSNCIQTKKPCTYLEASKPRGPPKAYVTGLEDRVEELENLLAQIRPHTDFSDELGAPVLRDSWKSQDRWALRQNKPRPAASRSHSPLGSPLSSAPAASPLPPLVIPFTQKSSSRTTHLLFKTRLKKQKSRAGSDYTVSSGSGSSTAIRTNPASPYASTSGSEYEYSDEDSDEDSNYLLASSQAGRSRLGLGMAETPQAPDNRILFHGRSSTAGLVETTRMLKHLHLQEAMGMDTGVKDEDTGKDLKVKVEGPDNTKLSQSRRAMYWQTPPWEAKFQALSDASSPKSMDAIPGYIARFPPPDLCRTLIKLYFVHSNNFFPLLHQQTFERQWNERVYERNIWFICLCFGVFAVASRWCEDERVLDNDSLPTDGLSWRSSMGGKSGTGPRDWTDAGWKYFEAGADIHQNARGLIYPANLFEIQSFTLMGMFLRGTQHAPIAWLAVSVGLRKAQDVGAHRKSIYSSEPNAEDELWKRAFWHLVAFDRLGGSALGRSVGISEEDFDLPFPLEVDDDYWTGPSAWKQPAGTPSLVSSFVHFLKLTQIVAFTSRSVYAIDKSKVFRGFIQGDWRVEVVSQLNTAMKEWLNDMPPHLVWSESANMEPIFFAQSAALYETYHLTTMLIYRPFIPAPPMLPTSLQPGQRESSPPPPLPFPALAICISACRACTRIIEVQLHRRAIECVHAQSYINAAFTCAGTLILALWDLKAQQRVLIKVKHAGVVINPDKERSMETGEDAGTEGGLGVPEEEATTDALLLSLKLKMDELVLDLKILVEALEWMKGRWEFAQSMLPRLRESMPSEHDLREDAVGHLSHSQPHRVGIVKHMSFQDMRRQRQREQQMEQEKRLHRKHSQPDVKPCIDLPTIPTSQWARDMGYSRHASTTSGLGSGSPISVHHHQQMEGVQQPGVDVNRFLQEHYPQMHTFADEDFDEPQESSIQLPTVPYPHSLPKAQGREHPTAHSPGNGCRCAECVGPVARGLARTRSGQIGHGLVPQQSYPISRAASGDEIHLRPVPQGAYPPESQSQFTSGALRREPSGSSSVQVPSHRPSQDVNFGRRGSATHTMVLSPHAPAVPPSRSPSTLQDRFGDARQDENQKNNALLPLLHRPHDGHPRLPELESMDARYRYSSSSHPGFQSHGLEYPPTSSEDLWKYSSSSGPAFSPFSASGGNFGRDGWENPQGSIGRPSILTAYPQNAHRLAAYQAFSDGAPRNGSFGV
ncbi:hypothetical protein FA15DRAFT_638902 [Coprinopsis marcescibilis]|uniref:Zn(2)-C6 fungal-type domain-containing protein n=1 Tax=Coprinopsis marcescibilis TaxID=230819 RepID=A0A5C3KZ56_COPMA|nr:hypothetical protein FA15DRAFT_638902 [Coprinopsis marcescibilis]